jgi:CDP-6-deoxy-D-xylo-4-hexulose-3-dehydrase
MGLDMMKVPIGGPFQTTPAMADNVSNVMQSGRLSPGPYCTQFERKFANWHDSQDAIMTNSGTSALIVALQAMQEIEGWGIGSEVIVPSITFVATLNAVLHCNLVPCIVDVDPTTCTLDVSQMVDKIKPGLTKAVIPVHAFGLPCEMFPMQSFATYYDLKIIEDACEALGATYSGQFVGGIGDIGCFSFYMSHHITAGIGGMAITSNPWYARKMRSLVNHGWEREKAPMDETEYDFDKIRRRYHFTSIGHSFRPSEFEAAIALAQLPVLPDILARRRQNAKMLSEGLKGFAHLLQLPMTPYNRSHAYMMYPIVLREGDKWQLIDHLEKNNIETREMLPLTNQPCYKGLFNETDYPVAKWINEQGFYIGCSQYLNEDHMAYVIEKFEEYFGN